MSSTVRPKLESVASAFEESSVETLVTVPTVNPAFVIVVFASLEVVPAGTNGFSALATPDVVPSFPCHVMPPNHLRLTIRLFQVWSRLRLNIVREVLIQE